MARAARVESPLSVGSPVPDVVTDSPDPIALSVVPDHQVETSFVAQQDDPKRSVSPLRVARSPALEAVEEDEDGEKKSNSGSPGTKKKGLVGRLIAKIGGKKGNCSQQTSLSDLS